MVEEISFTCLTEITLIIIKKLLQQSLDFGQEHRLEVSSNIITKQLHVFLFIIVHIIG